MIGGKLPGVTWAVLSAYAATPEGAALPALPGALRAHAPRGRARSVAVVTAQAGGVLTPEGGLTPAGLKSARLAVQRHGLGGEA